MEFCFFLDMISDCQCVFFYCTLTEALNWLFSRYDVVIIVFAGFSLINLTTFRNFTLFKAYGYLCSQADWDSVQWIHKHFFISFKSFCHYRYFGRFWHLFLLLVFHMTPCIHFCCFLNTFACLTKWRGVELQIEPETEPGWPRLSPQLGTPPVDRITNLKE